MTQEVIPILSLWQPILASSVLIFAASSIVHMVFKYHNKEFRQLPSEEATLETLHQAGVSPGLYHFPHCASPQDMAKPEVAAKYARGPVGFLTVVASGVPNMGKYLIQWFLYIVLVGVFLAYLAGRTFGAGEHYLTVFRFVGTAAFLTYGVSSMIDSIWKGAPWSATCKHVFDGLVYSLLAAGVFGWLWP